MSKLLKIIEEISAREDFNMIEAFHEGFEYALKECANEEDRTLPEGLVLDEVYSKGGCEGGGDEVIFVVEGKDNGKSLGFVMITGWYASYDGVHFDDDDFKVVQPYTFTETRYK